MEMNKDIATSATLGMVMICNDPAYD